METVKTVNPLLKAFQEQKLTKANIELMQAQKLVNLYRALDCFQDGFADKFNEMLLESSVESRRMLSTIMGGSEVRNYLDFLEQQTNHTDEENNPNSSKQLKGFLPSPDMDESPTSNETVQISRQEWLEMQEQQRNLMEQTKNLMSMVKNNSMGQSATVENTPVKNYSEIIEDDV